MTKKWWLAATLISLTPVPALAHPHIFVEARMEVLSNDKGEVTEVRNVWRFDELFSSSVLLDFDKNTNGKLDDSELAELGETMRTSLADFHYFTTITQDGKKYPRAEARHHSCSACRTSRCLPSSPSSHHKQCI